MKIKKEILAKTLFCKKDFACINSADICCRVKRCINNEVHIVECVQKNICNYKVVYGDAFICTCPTRAEIYKKHSK